MNLWNKVSNIGLSTHKELRQVDLKRLLFFNQVLFFGVFLIWFQILAFWQFIGVKSLIFLVITLVSIISLYLNSKGRSYWSKRIFIITVYAVGTYTTVLIGGSGLYHLGALLILICSLLLFDIKTEKTAIAVGLPFLIMTLCVGELGWFNAPDFSAHSAFVFMRFSSIANLFVVIFVLTIFILRLNQRNEEKLSNHKEELEELVKLRTGELEAQKSKLEKQNSENIMLLKEVHHRVKNNLQIIVSLVNLQMSKYDIDNQVVSEALLEIQGRVLSMSLVHEEMYRTSDFVSIDLEKYIESLIENIKGLYVGQKIEYDLDFCKESVCDIETAIPIGLIFNEVISNFFKHVSLLNEPNFSISLKSESDSCVLTYRDKGPGFPTDYKIDEEVSLGLQLIESLTEQIDGEFNFYNDNGAVYEIKFHQKKTV